MKSGYLLASMLAISVCTHAYSASDCSPGFKVYSLKYANEKSKTITSRVSEARPAYTLYADISTASSESQIKGSNSVSLSQSYVPADQHLDQEELLTQLTGVYSHGFKIKNVPCVCGKLSKYSNHKATPTQRIGKLTELNFGDVVELDPKQSKVMPRILNCGE